MSLSNKKCQPCSGQTPRLSVEKQDKLLSELESWKIVGGHHLSRSYTFANFTEALAWVNKIAQIAEEENHHPDVYLTWGKVRIDIWTHAIDGLTESDFILAAKFDSINK